jgi:hypothetical protein
MRFGRGPEIRFFFSTLPPDGMALDGILFVEDLPTLF